MNTIHSLNRAKERAGMNKDRANRFMDLAYNRGMTAGEMPWRERCYMESKEKEASSTAIYYNGYIFIWGNDEVSITLFHAPEWFFEKHHCDGKKQIRNIRKYRRFYDNGEEAA